jgi:hypothetical protein
LTNLNDHHLDIINTNGNGNVQRLGTWFFFLCDKVGREYSETATVTGLELDMQELGVTAASDREGGQGKVGREYSETSTVTGIQIRHARIGRHCCF